MKTQEEFLKEILQLVKANPEMEVHFCVDSGELTNMSWTKHKISRVVIQPFFERDETIYVSEDAIKEILEDEIMELGFGSSLPPPKDSLEEEMTRLVEEKYSKIKKAICVYTEAS